MRISSLLFFSLVVSAVPTPEEASTESVEATSSSISRCRSPEVGARPAKPFALET